MNPHKNIVSKNGQVFLLICRQRYYEKNENPVEKNIDVLLKKQYEEF